MFSKNGIRATFIFISAVILMYSLRVINPNEFLRLFVLKTGFENFFPWQIFTYIFWDNSTTLSFFFKVLILFWFSSTLEAEWGTLHYSLFLVAGILGKSLTAILWNLLLHRIPFEAFLNGYDSLLYPNSLMLSLMIAYGFIHKDEVIYLFFILPIKVKLLSIISMVFASIQILLLFTASNPFHVNLVFVSIYLSGYLGVFLYAQRIFDFPRFNFKLAKFKRKQTPLSNSVQETNLEILDAPSSDSSLVKTPASDHLPLCDPIDFEENDAYCQTCNRYPRCLQRKKENG